MARGEVGGVDLLAHSVAVVVPSLTALGTGLALPSMVGPGFWISTLLGFAIVGLLAQTFHQFASRFGSAGTLYTFVAKGLGPIPALMVGGGLVVGYCAMIGFGLGDGTSRFDAALTSSGVHPPGGRSWIVALFVAGAALCLYAMSRGIHWSTRAALIAEVASFAILTAVLLTWTARDGLPTWDAFSLTGASPARILAGAATIVTLTLAFESSASLGLETKRPFRDVPFALRSSLLLAFGLFVLANLVATTRPADAPSIWSWRWFAPGAERSVLDAVVLVVLAWSLLALALCVWCALARLVFTLAREGVLPDALGKTNARGIPMIAAYAVTPLAIGGPVVSMASGSDAFAFAWDLKQSATVVICIGYVLAATALPRFLWSIDELTPAVAAAAAVAAVGAMAVAVHEFVDEVRRGAYLALVLLAFAATLGLVMRIFMRRSHELRDRYVGMHDEALSSAVVLPPNPPIGIHAEL